VKTPAIILFLVLKHSSLNVPLRGLFELILFRTDNTRLCVAFIVGRESLVILLHNGLLITYAQRTFLLNVDTIMIKFMPALLILIIEIKPDIYSEMPATDIIPYLKPLFIHYLYSITIMIICQIR
jgi:hypothetical protein